MAETASSSLFELSIDHESTQHLMETARWGKFMAIAGFIGCGLMVVFAFVFGAILSHTLATRTPLYSRDPTASAFGYLGGAAIGMVYAVFAAIAFFPFLFLYKFSVRMKTALNTNDQVMLNQSLNAQRLLFRYVGVITIIGLAMDVIGILMIGVTALVAGFR